MEGYFQSLGQLSEHVSENGWEIPDAGVPLDWTTPSNSPEWRTQPSIRKVTSFIARNTASVPLHVYDRVADDDRPRLTDGPLANLLRRPSRAPGMTPYRFWESILVDGLIYDRWCARILEHDDGFELVRIPARMVKFHADSLDRIDHLSISGKDGKTREVSPEGFILDVGYAERGANGTSPMETMRHILQEYNEAIAYRRALWKNGARTPFALSREKPWPNEAARDRFAAGWRQFMRGGGSEGGTPVLDDGMKPVPMEAFRPRDTQDLEGRRLTDIEVASAYFVPPELVGAREGTFANVKAFRQMLFGPVLGPYIDAWQQQLNSTLVPLLEPDRNAYIEAHVDAKIRGSFEEQADILSTSTGAPWMTRNEARARQNLPAIDGGDELIVPLNVLEGGQASPQDGKAVEQVLAKFEPRQQQVVVSQRAAGVHDWWDRDRWDRELIDDLKQAGVPDRLSAAIARQYNDEAERRYLEETR